MTRVTQSMLSANMLRNLNTSYSKMSKYQDQINSGRMYTRASDDPVAATKGMNYRVELDKVSQFERNLNEAYSWVDTTDSTLDEVTTSLHRVKELVTQAANDTNTADDREKIAVELKSIQEALQGFANTQVGGKYLFSGTNTSTPLFKDGTIADPTVQTGLKEAVNVEVMEGSAMAINIPGYDLFKNIDEMMTKITTALNDPQSSGQNITGLITDVDNATSDTLDARAQLGASQNRIDTVANRLSSLQINITKRLSENEDTDYAETISRMTEQESIHQAALSVGAKIIKQTLVDFL